MRIKITNLITGKLLSEYYNRNLYLLQEEVEHSVKPTVNFIKDFIRHCDPDTPPSNKLIEFERDVFLYLTFFGRSNITVHIDNLIFPTFPLLLIVWSKYYF